MSAQGAIERFILDEDLSGSSRAKIARDKQQFLVQEMLIELGLGTPLLLMTLVSKSPARVLYSYLFG